MQAADGVSLASQTLNESIKRLRGARAGWLSLGLRRRDCQGKSGGQSEKSDLHRVFCVLFKMVLGCRRRFRLFFQRQPRRQQDVQVFALLYVVFHDCQIFVEV